MKDERAPNQKKAWNDLRSLSPKMIQCRHCGDRVIIHGSRIYEYPSWVSHKCDAKVKVYTKEEIEELNAKIRSNQGNG